MTPRVTLLRRVALVSTVFSFALVAWGAIVRINGAGMTCPDWPRCRGAWFPALDPKVVYEYYHRVGAAALTAIVVATWICALLARAELPAAWRASWVSIALIAAQVAAGAVTIVRGNDAPSVAVHLVLGFATFVSLLVVTIAAHLPSTTLRPPGRQRALGALAAASAALCFIAVFAAGWMAASNDGLACTGLPLCGAVGALTPDQQIHMMHRFAAYATIVAVAAVWIVALRTPGLARPVVIAAWCALALVLLQGVLGAAAVATRLAPVIRSWHEANGALLVASLVATAYLAYRAAPRVG